MNPERDNVRHAIKTQWDWTIPVGRGQRFGTDMHPILNGIVGGWQFSGAARIQARMVDFGNVRLVGMTREGSAGACTTSDHPTRIPANPAATPYMLPDDVILNTRRAFSTSTDVADRLLGSRRARRAATSRRPTAPTASSSRPATARRGRC